MLTFINSALNFTLFLFIVLPISLLIAYICASILSSFIGGPFWLWLIIAFILSLPVTGKSVDKATTKIQNTTE